MRAQTYSLLSARRRTGRGSDVRVHHPGGELPGVDEVLGIPIPHQFLSRVSQETGATDETLTSSLHAPKTISPYGQTRQSMFLNVKKRETHPKIIRPVVDGFWDVNVAAACGLPSLDALHEL